MALVVNGTTVKKLVVNGTTVKKAVANGVTVYNAEMIFVTGSSLKIAYTVRKLVTTTNGSVSGVKLSNDYGIKIYGVYWAVDVTNYDTLHYSINIVNGNGEATWVHWGVYSNIGTQTDSRDTVVRPSGLKTVDTQEQGTFTGTLDVSGISGTRYIWVYVDAAGSSCSSRTVTIKELKLT